MKNLIVSAAAALLITVVSSVAIAEPGYRGMAQQMGADSRADDPAQVLQEGMEKLIAFLKSGQNKAHMGAFLSAEVGPYFDFPYMARAAAGPLSRHMTDEQLVRLEKKLEMMFLGAMAEKLSRYDNQDVAFMPARFNSVDRATVTVLINNPGSYPGRIDFRMHQTRAGWKIYDIAANGASAIAYYRTYFRKAMRGN